MPIRIKWLLPAVLNTTGGMVDVIGFLALDGPFTAHITGNLVVLTTHYVTGGFNQVAPLLLVPVFVAVLGALMLAVGTPCDPRASRRKLLILQLALLGGFLGFGIAFGPFVDPGSALAMLAGMLGVAAMATRGALVKLALRVSPSTAVLTTNTTQLAVDPKCCIHFEDWTGSDAIHLLKRYREKYCIYNDDVQGTGGIALAGMINAAKLKGTKLMDEKYLFLGAGSAAVGLGDLICSSTTQQGLTLAEAQSKVHMFDVNGLLEDSRKDRFDFQTPYAHEHAPTRDFVAAVVSINPATIIGVSTVGGLFTQKVIESLSRINERPLVLALSKPTAHAERTAEQAYTWSKGKAIYSAGVQFPPVHFDGRTFLPGQANNLYIFPAIGMAVFATQASRITDQMFIESAQAVADQVPSEMLKQGLLFPLQSNILESEIQTAARVAKLIFDPGLARVERPADMVAFIRKHVYKPEYASDTAPAFKAA
jgi:malic enzyme